MSTVRFAPTKRHLKRATLQLAILAVAACTNPAGMQHAGEQTGMLAVSSGSSSIGAQTVFPQVEQELIDSYRIVLEGGPAAPTERTVPASDTGGFPEDVVIEDVVPGTWETVTITAYDGADPDADGTLAVLRGTNDDPVTVAQGEFTDVNIPLEFIDDSGTGNIEFEVSWPDDSDVYNLAYSIVPFSGGSPAPAWTNIDDTNYSGPDEDDRLSYT
ncbi:MAG: hypothetical protein ACOCZ9_02960, partial [Spirochaetota bacterium]